MDQWNHGTTEYTQTNWNGITGDISLYAKEKAYIRQINVYPDVSSKAVEVSVQPAPPKDRTDRENWSYASASKEVK